ncbi:hypothetical protein Sango_1863400 [Sesamum angolense]|uniref:Uncharacterized protein n=1 Tax=Sesamum angolense TaxID=2727404 RepID=A0AAE1WIH2_9LAMI|nr:hypothetical protein Sango_1863400 [Sesamum angolense]
MGKGYEIRGNFGPRNNVRRKGPVDKRHLTCEICHKAGHNKETCFKLHGVPEWYKELSDQRKKNGNGTRAYAVNDNNSVDILVNASTNAGSDLVADIMEALRIIQTNKMPQDPVRVHFAQGDEMAGMSLNKMDQTTKHILELGRQVWKLYYLDKSSFVSVSPAKYTDSITSTLPVPDSSPSVPALVPPIPPSSRPHRTIKPPTWLRDFHCHSSFDHSCNFASSHNAFMAALSTIREPNHYLQAKGIMEWENAMKEELAAIE